MYNLIIAGEKNYDRLILRLKPYLSSGHFSLRCILAENKIYVSIPVYSIENASLLIDKEDYILISHEMMSKPEVVAGLDEKHLIPQEVMLDYVGFNLYEYIELIKKGITIISDTCWGGMVYHALGLKFTSPLINTSVAKDDFLRLISDLEYYLSCEMEMYSERNAFTPPIGMLGGEVKIMFNHYLDFSEGKEAWDKRKKRVHYDNIFVQMDKVLSEADKVIFDNCPYRKIYFSRQIDSGENAIYLTQYESSDVRIATGEFTGYVQNLIQRKPIYPRPIDLLKMLNGKKFEEYIRIR